MVEPENNLFERSDGWAMGGSRDQQRLKALTELGLHQPEMIPVFEEATQTAAHFLDAPICILGFVDQERHWFKSAVGLSRLGLMNQLAQTRQLLRHESFCSKVVDSCQFLVINDTHTFNDPSIVNSKLVQDYGIRAYVGAPLIDATGNCLGSLAVMDLSPRNFTRRDVEFLQVIARWSMSEFERNRLLKSTSTNSSGKNAANWALTNSSVTEVKINSSKPNNDTTGGNQIKLELLEQLTQELRTPLTSVLGMASVMAREIYGPLTTKQKEYVEIIQHSGRYLLSLVNEIAELGTIDPLAHTLNLTPVDVEMLCQQAINTLEEAAHRRAQDIRLSLEPGRNRIWTLDKEKVRQMLYHLIFSVIQVSATGSVVRIHVSYKEEKLNITIWVSHPWLGDGLTEVDPYLYTSPVPFMSRSEELAKYSPYSQEEEMGLLPVSTDLMPGLRVTHAEIINANIRPDVVKYHGGNLSRESLGLLLSCQLAELHGGQISIQGSSESGYRYVVTLPLNLPTTQTVSDS
ncbi:MAG: GAF domain-containing sensor histidine kinase [Nostocaceae cyanobacterium]|nr:GAF domain-containing sensor histidine kinase [Nostocaceae cyanobacterium]